MNILQRTKTFALASTLALCAIGFSPGAKADEWNKKTIITITEPMQVPNNIVLQPGKYVLKLLNSPSDRHIVQIFNEAENKLYTTILAIPNYRLQPTGKSTFTFWETPAGQPHALRAWFYPGDNFGQEFAYSPSMSAQIASYNKSSVPTSYSQSTEDLATSKLDSGQASSQPAQTQSDTATVTEPNRASEPAAPPTMAAAPAPPVSEPVTQPQPEPSASVSASDNSSASSELPHTATPYPLIALAGLLSLGLSLVIGLRIKRSA